MPRDTAAGRRATSPLDLARASLVLDYIGAEGAIVGELFFRAHWKLGLSRSEVNRALNLLEARGLIRLVPYRYGVCAVRVGGEADK